MFAPNGMRVLAGLGLGNKIFESDKFVEVPWLHIYDSNGSLLGKVPGGSKERFEYTSIMILRMTILEILHEDAEKRGIEVRFGAKVKSLQESDDGVVVGWTENGEEKESKADLVVGADGIWSVVRKSVYAHLKSPVPKPTYQGLTGAGGIVPISSVPKLDTYITRDQPITMIQGRSGFFALTLYNAKADSVIWWSTYESPEKARDEWQAPKEQTLDEVNRHLKGWAFPVEQVLQAAAKADFKPMIFPTYEVDNLKYWHTSRIVLIGDAAHATPPHAGQGASQALEDAAYLSYLLRKLPSLSGSGAPTSTELNSVLSAFQEARQPRANQIIAEANKRGNSKRELSAVGYFVKRWAMKLVLVFMKESWMDDWFGYKVPGIKDWSN